MSDLPDFEDPVPHIVIVALKRWVYLGCRWANPAEERGDLWHHLERYLSVHIEPFERGKGGGECVEGGSAGEVESEENVLEGGRKGLRKCGEIRDGGGGAYP